MPSRCWWRWTRSLAVKHVCSGPHGEITELCRKVVREQSRPRCRAAVGYTRSHRYVCVPTRRGFQSLRPGADKAGTRGRRPFTPRSPGSGKHAHHPGSHGPGRESGDALFGGAKTVRSCCTSPRRRSIRGVPPFPLMHVDTRWKFQAMYRFRDEMARESGMDLIVYVNPEGVDKDINPFDHGSSLHTDVMKTSRAEAGSGSIWF